MGRAARAKRERGLLPPWTPFEEGTYPPGVTKEPQWRSTWVNSRYQVDVSVLRPNVEGMPEMTVLSIKRRDKDWLRDWRDLQRIKNEILGPEWEAVELFPAESRLVDSSNQYWLWCLPPPHRFPFGMDERIVSDVELVNPRGGSSRQRPFDPDQRRPDMETVESATQRIERAGLSGYTVRKAMR